MFNSNRPTLEELPTSAQLLKSTAIAAVSAVAILVTVVLPAEYGIDPTGIGRAIGLTEMGEIKTELAEEAAQDHSSLLDDLFGLFVGSAAAREAVEAWRDEVSFTLAPGDSAEWKLSMTKGQTAIYRMTVTGGRVNYDLHGHGGSDSATYEKARGSTGAEGPILALFDGSHGWFFRNRDTSDVAVTIQLRGEYQDFKEEN